VSGEPGEFHFTTIATFVRELNDEIANLFTQVLFLCDAQGQKWSRNLGLALK
jgi:hypothetical protein